MMGKYRKKPVVIEAIKTEWGSSIRKIADFVGQENLFLSPEGPIITTLEGDMKVSPGDYIIKGVNGEFYPIKESIFLKTYEKVEEGSGMSKNAVTQAQINAILDDSIIDTQTALGKCTVVTCQLPNGFIIVESSACVDPANYDEELGAEICLKRIENKVWELEGYKLQSELASK